MWLCIDTDLFHRFCISILPYFGHLAGVVLDSWILHSSCYVVLMAETGDCANCDLSQMRMFDGSDFAAWQECMRSALTQRGLHGPLSGHAGRPCDMYDDQWRELDVGIIYTLFAPCRVYLCSCYA